MCIVDVLKQLECCFLNLGCSFCSNIFFDSQRLFDTRFDLLQDVVIQIKGTESAKEQGYLSPICNINQQKCKTCFTRVCQKPPAIFHIAWSKIPMVFRSCSHPNPLFTMDFLPRCSCPFAFRKISFGDPKRPVDDGICFT